MDGTRNNSLISQSGSLISATRRPYNDDDEDIGGGGGSTSQHHRQNSKNYGTKRSAQDSAAFWAERAKVAAVVKKNHHELITGTGQKQHARDITPVDLVPRRILRDDQVVPCRLPIAVQDHLIQEYLGYSNDKTNGGALTLKTLPLFLVSIGLQLSSQFNMESYFAARGNNQGDARIVQPDELLGVVEAMEFGETTTHHHRHHSSNTRSTSINSSSRGNRTYNGSSSSHQRNGGGGGGTVVDQLEDELSPTRRRSNHYHQQQAPQHKDDAEEDNNGGVDAHAVTQRLLAAYGVNNSSNAAQATQTLLRELHDAREPEHRIDGRGNSPLRSFLGDEASSSDFHTMSLRAFRIITGENELEEECLEATAEQIVSACEVYYGDHRYHQHHHHHDNEHQSKSSKQKYPHATTISSPHQLPPQQLAGRTALLHEINMKHRSDSASPRGSRSASPSRNPAGSPVGMGASFAGAAAMGNSTHRAAAVRLKLPGRGGASSSAAAENAQGHHPATWDVYKSSVASAIIDRLSQTGSSSPSTSHSRAPTAPPSRHASSRTLSILPTPSINEATNHIVNQGAIPSTSCSMDLLNFQHQLRTDIADLHYYLEERGIHTQHDFNTASSPSAPALAAVRLPLDHRLVIAELVAHVFPFCIQRLCGKYVLIALRNTRALDCQEPLYSLVLKRDGPKKLQQRQNSKKSKNGDRQHSISDDQHSSNNNRAIMGVIAQAQNIQNKLLADLSPDHDGGHHSSVWARDAQGNISGRICASPQHHQQREANHKDDEDDHGASKDPSFEDHTNKKGDCFGGGGGANTPASSASQPHYLTPRARDAHDDIHKAQLERASFRKIHLNEMRERRRFEQRPYSSPRTSTTTSPQRVRNSSDASGGVGPTPPTTPSGNSRRRPNTAAAIMSSSPSTPTLMALMAARKSPSRLTSQSMVIPTPPRELVDGTSSCRSPRKSLTSDPRTMAAENLSCRPGTSGRPVEDISPAEAEVEKEAARFDRPYHLHMPRIGQYRHFHGAKYPSPVVSHTPPRSASNRKATPNQPSPTSVFKFQHLAERPKSSTSSTPKKKKGSNTKKVKKNTGASIVV